MSILENSRRGGVKEGGVDDSQKDASGELGASFGTITRI